MLNYFLTFKDSQAFERLVHKVMHIFFIYEILRGFILKYNLINKEVKKEMLKHTNDYLLDKKIKMFQNPEGYKTSSDAVLLSSFLSNLADGAKILDVGSGTGGISLCLAYRFKNVEIKGLEVQEDLAALANLSAKENGFKNLEYICHDIQNKVAPFEFCSFDCVVTNPPYEQNGTKSPNKSKATAHNQGTINLEGWLSFCLKMLKPYGFLYLIHRTEALSEILKILSPKAGHFKIVPIYSRSAQKAKRIMIMAQKDSKTPLEITEPLIIHDENGYTLKANAILRKGEALF